VRLAALNLKGISGGGSRIPESETVISGILRFHINSLFSLFCITSLLCNYVESCL